MKAYLIFFVFIATTLFTQAQSTHDIMIGGSGDVIKTDIQKVFNKAQFSAEMNYFVVRHFAVGGGGELWTNRNYRTNTNSFVMGMRWYADDKIFIRLRTLVGANQVALGAGWSQPINKVWRVEAIGDFYFHGEFAFRAGICYVIRRN